MPTAAINTYAVSWIEPIERPDLALVRSVSLVDGTYAKGTVLGQVTANAKFQGYVDAAGDGSGVAKAILKYACVVASGLITVANAEGVTELTTPAYFAGSFNVADLTGYDAAAVADLNGRVDVAAAGGIATLTF